MLAVTYRGEKESAGNAIIGNKLGNIPANAEAHLVWATVLRTPIKKHGCQQDRCVPCSPCPSLHVCAHMHTL